MAAATSTTTTTTTTTANSTTTTTTSSPATLNNTWATPYIPTKPKASLPPQEEDTCLAITMRDARVEEPPENANVDVIHPGWERTRHTDHSMEIPALSSGLQPRAIQEMLDFDYSCGRSTPSVAAMIYPFGGHYIQKFYWGTKETLLPPQCLQQYARVMDYKWAQELGLIREPAAFISTISDERDQKLLYAGMRISDAFKEDVGVGGVVSLLWFICRLPPWATKFIEMVLIDCRSWSDRLWRHEHHRGYYPRFCGPLDEAAAINNPDLRVDLVKDDDVKERHAYPQC
ncbi:hypothetical protein F5887DRAFT_1187788 [Amanita rubescens]|nr:hypothetical protein F5887DRAFT_1187788 [Amanita rubescens]